MEMEILPLEELAEVEAWLQASLSSEISVVTELGDYLLQGKGKRLRPALAILFYKLFGGQGDHETLVEMATVLELVHLATLVHDDVIDESAERRGRPALWTVFGNRMAVLQGDFIFSRVFATLNRQEARLRFLVTDTVEEILAGELLQEELRWRIPTEAEYFEVIRRKTAALISAACAVGALIGDPGVPEEQFQRVREAGLLLGIAYQMADDLLDIFGDGHLGKPRWKDRDEGW
ncbi:MAG: polyprenyl synthetase family protein, partial [Candidatus Bipolaricaulia bacterium]